MRDATPPELLLAEQQNMTYGPSMSAIHWCKRDEDDKNNGKKAERHIKSLL